MSQSSHQIRQSDVTGWGIAALVCGAVAVFSANVATALPDPLMAGLHGTRMAGANVSQMRELVAETRETADQLASANRAAQSRIDRLDRTSTDMRRRVAAVEQSIPMLVESLPDDPGFDRDLLTASIDAIEREREEVEGGMMALSRTAMVPGAMGDDGDFVPNQPLPPAAEPDTARAQAQANQAEQAPAQTDPIETAAIPDTDDSPSPGVAARDPRPLAVRLGANAQGTDPAERWQNLQSEAGPLLIGLEARTRSSADGGTSTLLAGPIQSEVEAEALCARLERIGQACAIDRFSGSALNPER